MSESADRTPRAVVVVGSGDLSDEVARALEAKDVSVEHLRDPDERELRAAIEAEGVDSVAVVERDDAFVLRMALIVRSLSEEIPLLLTIFERTMAAQVERDVPNTKVTSLADIVAPSLAGPCIDERATAVSVEGDEPVLLVADDGAAAARNRCRSRRRTAPRLWSGRSSRPTTRARACCSTARSGSSPSS